MTKTRRSGGDSHDAGDRPGQVRLGRRPAPRRDRRPEIADDEVLVRVRAAGLDRGTWHLMTGRPYLMRPRLRSPRPKNPVPGLDVAGTVVAVGSAVTRFAVGDEVFGIGRGTFAEYAAAREDKLARKPANLTFEQAAVVPVSGGHRAAGTARRGRVAAGPAGADHRGVRRRRQLRRADGQGVRRRGHRRVQHGEDRPGALARRRPRHRLHPRRLRRRLSPLRPDPRHRRQPSTPRSCAEPSRRPGRPSSSAARKAAGGPAASAGPCAQPRCPCSSGSGWRCSWRRSTSATSSGSPT